MASNTNKRIPIKWVRDRAKAAYEKQDRCFICDSTLDLELHHTHSVTLLLEKWREKTGYDISTDDGILAVRDEFIADHKDEIFKHVFTLCNKHHVKLHSIYGKAPPLGSAQRQANWIETQRQKHQSGDRDAPTKSLGSFFSEFT